MNRKFLRIAFFIALLFFIPIHTRTQESKWNGPSVDFSHGGLQVSPNGRYLQFEDGTPFFYLGDTAWELFHRLDREEANKYLENRREKGFTVIQAVALAELDGLNTPNPYGETPLIDNNPTQPNEAYWEHVDYIIEKAEEKGAWDMTHVRKLMLSRPFYSRIPDQSIIASGQGNYTNHVAATRGDGYAMVFLPANREVKVNPEKLSADSLVGWWFNPRTGKSNRIGEFAGDQKLQFDTPVKGVDWVLVLDDTDKNYPKPGTTNYFKERN